MINKIISIIRVQGYKGLLQAIVSRVLIKKADCYPMAKEIVSHGYGIEIGGISSIFKKNNILPIYPYIQSLDNCNFSNTTVWEGDITKGFNYAYDKNHVAGQQFVLEATDLYKIKNDSYDFLLSSHVIEHIANPLKALDEWIRVIKPSGHLILLVPHKDGTFDHRRPITSLDHLIQDYKDNVTEDDLTHLDEILKYHDLSLDPEAGTKTQFTERSKKNLENRCLHHHIFNSHLVLQLLDSLHLKIKALEAILPMHILVIAQKTEANVIPDNSNFFNDMASNKFKTPFASDKI